MMEPYPFVPPQACERPYTVSEINEGVAFALESGNTLVWVEAELSGVKPASSGHCYFRLKDRESQIPAVMWRSNVAKHPFEAREGMAVTVIALLRVYRKGGYYQLDVQKMQPAGIGAQYAALEKLRARLRQEGLFDPQKKKPLPETVTALGVITAKTGAALWDIVRVVAKRAPRTDILLRSVPVQGAEAPPEIAAAIREMNEYGGVDCIVLGRGGGSAQDLWAFNDERVVRAIHESKIPLISAVGHEIDVTLADFAADVRAPTPSAAAEIAVADEQENRRYFDGVCGRFSSLIRYNLASRYEAYRGITRHRAFKRTLHRLAEARQACDVLHERALRAVASNVKTGAARFAQRASQLQALSPLATLGRGYSAVTRADGTLVKDAGALHTGEHLSIRFSKGRAAAAVTSVET